MLEELNIHMRNTNLHSSVVPNITPTSRLSVSLIIKVRTITHLEADIGEILHDISKGSWNTEPSGKASGCSL